MMPSIIIHSTRAAIDLWQHMPLRAGDDERLSSAMTITARQALEDCHVAVDSLVDGVKGSEWKRQWLLAIVLLRAVGHVLHKVDRKQSQAYRSAIDSWWSEMQATKPEPAIFWQFIYKYILIHMRFFSSTA